MKMYVCERNEINKSAIDLLKRNGFSDLSETRQAEADVLFIRTYTTVDKEFLSKFTRLKYILKAGVGLDKIDLKICQTRGIEVINAPGSNANAVAEYVICTIIFAARSINQQNLRLRKGLWRNRILIGSELQGSVLGIVGCGAIGQQLARKVNFWELKKILGYDPFLDKEILKECGIQKSTLKQLLKESDFITLHLPLNPMTKNLITQEKIRLMKKSAVLINAARGGIINEKDLIYALGKKIIKAAVLDVFEQEPAINLDLLTLDNLYTTPHIAALTMEAEKEMALSPVRQLLAITKHKSLNFS
ncbi:MAG: NAD(P)-dependent oxidoreductase [Patescibacteria group bacterium]|nr:hypothetical protein [Patescibacteria group bacterium]